MRPTKSKSWFSRFAKVTARYTGKPLTFMLAILIILVWAITGIRPGRSGEVCEAHREFSFPSIELAVLGQGCCDSFSLF